MKSMVLAAAPSVSFAHDLHALRDNPWTAWQLAPDVIVTTAVAAILYLAGVLRLGGRTMATRAWAQACFFGGLAAVILALQSPVDAVAEHLFFVHQIQHLLLHTAGPMFIMLATPQGPLVAGMPQWLRRFALKPVMTNPVIRAVFGFLARPAVATILFVASVYFWQIPGYHDRALLDEPLHYLMHVSMLFAGLVFFWRVFDPRPAPLGASFGVRLAMVWASIVATILIGAFIALKSSVLYQAYDVSGRIWGVSAISDERYGGLIIWIPGGMMYVVAMLAVIRLWGAQEEKMELPERRRHAEMPRGPRAALRVGGSEPPLAVQNRRLALRLATVSLAVIAVVLVVASLYRAWR
ncbi:MAG TPA: cytochrome c oxidase assembly protein [Burkholderiales bacterium]|nr:cytochrome c oxidase assembly protein [Burkholderiales bacterium]